MSQSAKVMGAITRALKVISPNEDVYPIDLAVHKLPLWDVEIPSGDEARVKELAGILDNSDAFVFVVPEWHGMVPAAMKNFFLFFSAGYLAHKPALIVSVSAGEGGSYPIAELRASSYKNSRICYLPEHLIVRKVEQVFNAEGKNDERSQAYLEERLNYCLEMLLCYSRGLAQVRKELPDASAFPNGM